MKGQRHVAVYGSVRIPRAFCDYCGDFSFILRGRYACCGGEFDGEAPEREIRMSGAFSKRRILYKRDKEEILKIQDQRCFYCDRRFGNPIRAKNKIVTLRIHFDHFNPLTYSSNNRKENFVASCHICNLAKSYKTFSSLEEVRTYVAAYWKTKGYKDILQDLR